MKIRFLILTLFFSFSIFAQEDPFQEDIISFLNNNGTREQYGGAYESMFDLLKHQFSVSNVPEDGCKLSKDKDKSLDEIVKFLSFAYRNHFTRDEIHEMDGFYSSETGKQYLLDPEGMSESQNNEVGLFFDTSLGKKIEEVRPDLTKDVMDISEHWSRELFASKMSILVKKGYTTGH